MAYSSECFSTAAVIETNMQQIEDNFDALRNHFANSTAPTSPDAGQLWYDTGSSMLKVRYNSSWVNLWDMDGQAVAPGQVKTDSLAAGLLSTDSTGRSKMANGFIKSSHVEDVDVTKVTNLNKDIVIVSAMPVQGSDTGYQPILPIIAGDPSTASHPAGRIYIPNTGAYKLKGIFMGGVNGFAATIKITVATCTVAIATIPGTPSTYADSSTYVDITAFAGTPQNISFSGDYVAQALCGYLLYLTT